MLLYGHSLTVLPHEHPSDDELNDPDYTKMEDHLNKSIKRLDLFIKQCWNRWKSEYLSALRAAHQAYEKKRKIGQRTNTIRVGDIVLVHSDTAKHSSRPLAVVIKLNHRQDGIVRLVDIIAKTSITKWPITRLYPLEVSLDDEHEKHYCIRH